MDTKADTKTDNTETKPMIDAPVRTAMQKASAAAGHLMEQAGERVEQAGEKVGEAALNVGVKVEEVGQKLKAAGKKLSHA